MYLNLKQAKAGITKDFLNKKTAKIEARRNHHFNTAFELGYNSIQEAIKDMGRVEFLEIANVNSPSINK